MKKMLIAAAALCAMSAFAQEPEGQAPAPGGEGQGEVIARPPREGKGPRKPGMAGPRVKKCDCCENCEGVILLPPGSTEGEPLFKGRGGPRQKGMGGQEGFRGPRHDGMHKGPKHGEMRKGPGHCGRKGGKPEGEMPPPPPAGEGDEPVAE